MSAPDAERRPGPGAVHSIILDDDSIGPKITTDALAIAERLSVPDVHPDIEAELVDRLAGIEGDA